MPYRTTGTSRWVQHSAHDPLELEHRITRAEVALETHEELHSEHRQRHGRLAQRMSLHEKAILAILAVLQVLAQDKWPLIADLLKGVRP